MKKFRIVLSIDTTDGIVPSYYLFLLDQDLQMLSTGHRPFNTFADAVTQARREISYCRQHTPMTQAYFSVCENYSKVVQQQFVNLNIYDDEAMLQLILTME